MLYLIYSVVCHPVMSYLVFAQTALYLLRHKDLTNFFYIIPDTTGGFVQNEKSLRGLFGTISPQSLFSSPLNAQLFFLFFFRDKDGIVSKTFFSFIRLLTEVRLINLTILSLYPDAQPVFSNRQKNRLSYFTYCSNSFCASSLP